ncbi:MAG: YidC/Oxa1 family membrane protein insertase [Acidimicrobiales bacterium]
MYDLIATILAEIYEVVGNYGLSIILLTIIVMIPLMPLTLKGTRSTIKMQQVQPEMKRIQKEHKGGDREAMNQELMALYQREGINPVGGCLPLLAQMPVFLVLFQVLRGLTRRLSESPWYEAAAALAEVRGVTPGDGRNFNPRFISQDTALFQDLRMTTSMSFGPLDLGEHPWDVLKDSFVSALPYVALILFVVGTAYFQQKQISARRVDDGSEVSPMMQQQMMLLRVMPVMTGIWSFIFPTGLVLYWATSNSLRIGQQAYITHQIYNKEGAGEKIAAARQQAKSIDDDGDDDGKGSSGKGAKKPKPGGGNNGGSGRASKKSSGSSSSDDGESSSSKQEAWERRRQEKAQTKKAGQSGSSRVTPKGTPPKKKRKR